ncbi:restriction endonuclease subunit S [Eubacterium sp. 1001713B170207_170306_E7]|uniref:restriction endonuclease subunit S n=1 Tax=Eubacterium sp. 1001713B170207_170306_E7 TaxID=2787097 RepID=UPI0018991DD0|nr:restriction endonuclease subunit S [Eubacterium sp. 1001713B170207_170306_E7]
MNYLTELLAFYKWLEANPLSPVLQAYWHLLMYYNNKAAVRAENGGWHWPVRFKVPNTVLMPLLGIKDRRVLLRQRGYLIDQGRVTYEKDKGQRAGIYRMVPFDRSLAITVLGAEKGDNGTQIWTPSVPPAVTEVSPFININHKQASLLYCNQEAPPNIHGFNLLPPLTDTEKAAIQALYPDDEVAAFEAMWAARERKQKGETP